MKKNYIIIKNQKKTEGLIFNKLSYSNPLAAKFSSLAVKRGNAIKNLNSVELAFNNVKKSLFSKPYCLWKLRFAEGLKSSFFFRRLFLYKWNSKTHKKKLSARVSRVWLKRRYPRQLHIKVNRWLFLVKLIRLNKKGQFCSLSLLRPGFSQWSAATWSSAQKNKHKVKKLLTKKWKLRKKRRRWVITTQNLVINMKTKSDLNPRAYKNRKVFEAPQSGVFFFFKMFAKRVRFKANVNTKQHLSGRSVLRKGVRRSVLRKGVRRSVLRKGVRRSVLRKGVRRSVLKRRVISWKIRCQVINLWRKVLRGKRLKTWDKHGYQLKYQDLIVLKVFFDTSVPFVLEDVSQLFLPFFVKKINKYGFSLHRDVVNKTNKDKEAVVLNSIVNGIRSSIKNGKMKSFSQYSELLELEIHKLIFRTHSLYAEQVELDRQIQSRMWTLGHYRW